MDIIIIGAGPAGLSSGYFLSKKGFHPTICEASKTVGGLAGKLNKWDRSFDIGPHIVLESCQSEAIELWREMIGDDMIELNLSRGMVLNSKLTNFPPTPFGLLKAFGIFKVGLATLSLMNARFQRQKSFAHSGDFFNSKFGSFFRTKIFNPFCEKYMGIPDNQVDLNFAMSLTSFADDSDKELLDTDSKKMSTILYPKSGINSFWLKLSESIKKRGEILLNKKVTHILTEKNRIIELKFEDRTSIKPDHLISSLPIKQMLKMMNDVPKDLLTEVNHLKSRSTILLYLLFEGESFNHQYITLFDHSTKIGRVTNFNAWKGHNLRENETVLCVEYWCSKEDLIWKSLNDQLINNTLKELESIDVLSSCKLIDSHIIKIANSHPVLDLKHTTIVKKANQYLAQFENLDLTGRHATFKWDGLADNISYGKKIADRIN